MKKILLNILCVTLLLCGCSLNMFENMEQTDTMGKDSVSISIDEENKLSVYTNVSPSVKVLLAENEQTVNSKKIIDDIFDFIADIEIYEHNPKPIDVDGCRIVIGSDRPLTLSTSQRKNVIYIWGYDLSKDDERQYISKAIYSEGLYDYIHNLLNVQDNNISDVLKNAAEISFEYRGITYEATAQQVKDICSNILQSKKESVLINSKYPIKIIFKTTDNTEYIAYLSDYFNARNMYLCGKFITFDESVMNLICSIINAERTPD